VLNHRENYPDVEIEDVSPNQRLRREYWTYPLFFIPFSSSLKCLEVCVLQKKTHPANASV
jgi:hypothetical protein